MKKTFLILSLLLPIAVYSQSVGRLPYETVRQVYRGDTLKTILGDSIRHRTNADAYDFDKPLVVQDTGLIGLIIKHASAGVDSTWDKIVVKDTAFIEKEVIVRDSTLIELISEHGGGTAYTAGIGIDLTGDSITIGDPDQSWQGGRVLNLKGNELYLINNENWETELDFCEGLFKFNSEVSSGEYASIMAASSGISLGRSFDGKNSYVKIEKEQFNVQIADNESNYTNSINSSPGSNGFTNLYTRGNTLHDDLLISAYPKSHSDSSVFKIYGSTSTVGLRKPSIYLTDTRRQHFLVPLYDETCRGMTIDSTGVYGKDLPNPSTDNHFITKGYLDNENGSNQLSGSITDDFPFLTEIEGIVGMNASQAGAGFRRYIKDTDGSEKVYHVYSDGSWWYYSIMNPANNVD